jgi:hypothetical protein
MTFGDGLSIVAILISGGAVYWAQKSSAEAKKTRQDALGVNVSIQVMRLTNSRWLSHGESKVLGYASPMETMFQSPGNDDDRILLGTVLRVTNNGRSLATITIGGFRVDDIAEPALEAYATELVPFGSLESLIQKGRFAIAPNEARVVLVRSGPEVYRVDGESTKRNRGADLCG